MKAEKCLDAWPWPGVLELVEGHPMYWEVPVQFLARAHVQVGCRLNP